MNNPTDRFELHTRRIEGVWTLHSDDNTMSGALAYIDRLQEFDERMECQIKFRHPDGTLEDVYFEAARCSDENDFDPADYAQVVSAG